MKTYGRRRRSLNGPTSKDGPVNFSPAFPCPPSSNASSKFYTSHLDVRGTPSDSEQQQERTATAEEQRGRALQRERRKSSLASVPVCSLGSVRKSPSKIEAFGVEVRQVNGGGGATEEVEPLLSARRLWGGQTGGRGGKKRRQGLVKGVQQGSAAKRRALAKSAEPEQTFIDFGQRSLGERSLCPRCNLLYVRGSGEDETRHAALCAKAAKGVEFAGWRQERVRARFPADGGRVIEVREGDPAPHLAKLREIEHLMDTDMGFAPGGRDQSVVAGGDAGRVGGGRGSSRTAATKTALSTNAFLYVRDKRVLGCVVAQRIQGAFRVLPDRVDGEGEGRAREEGVPPLPPPLVVSPSLSREPAMLPSEGRSSVVSVDPDKVGAPDDIENDTTASVVASPAEVTAGSISVVTPEEQDREQHQERQRQHEQAAFTRECGERFGDDPAVAVVNASGDESFLGDTALDTSPPVLSESKSEVDTELVGRAGTGETEARSSSVFGTGAAEDEKGGTDAAPALAQKKDSNDLAGSNPRPRPRSFNLRAWASGKATTAATCDLGGDSPRVPVKDQQAEADVQKSCGVSPKRPLQGVSGVDDGGGLTPGAQQRETEGGLFAKGADDRIGGMGEGKPGSGSFGSQSDGPRAGGGGGVASMAEAGFSETSADYHGGDENRDTNCTPGVHTREAPTVDEKVSRTATDPSATTANINNLHRISGSGKRRRVQATSSGVVAGVSAVRLSPWSLAIVSPPSLVAVAAAPAGSPTPAVATATNGTTLGGHEVSSSALLSEARRSNAENIPEGGGGGGDHCGGIDQSPLTPIKDKFSPVTNDADVKVVACSGVVEGDGKDRGRAGLGGESVDSNAGAVPAVRCDWRGDAGGEDGVGDGERVVKVEGLSPPQEGQRRRARTWSLESTTSSSLASPSTPKEEEALPPLPSSVLVCDEKEVPAVVGILQIWVHGESRRQGVATRLVDTARQKMVYGLSFRREQIAFSQPTREGQAFATHYTGGKLLVY